MFRDNRQTALNDLAVACKEAADYYRDDAHYAAGLGLEQLFLNLAEERREMAARLDQHIRGLHDLPSEPDTDRETLHSLLTRLRAGFSGDRSESLLEERQAGERALEEAVERALDEDLEAGTRDLLWELRGQVRAARQRLVDEANRLHP